MKIIHCQSLSFLRRPPQNSCEQPLHQLSHQYYSLTLLQQNNKHAVEHVDDDSVTYVPQCSVKHQPGLVQ